MLLFPHTLYVAQVTKLRGTCFSHSKGWNNLWLTTCFSTPDVFCIKCDSKCQVSYLAAFSKGLSFIKINIFRGKKLHFISPILILLDIERQNEEFKFNHIERKLTFLLHCE